MRKSWIFQVDEQVHTVTLDHGILDYSRRICLDGDKIIYVPPALKVDWGSRHEFFIGPNRCEVIIRSTLGIIAYDLEINGQSIRAGRFKPINHTLLRAAEAPAAGQKVLLRAAQPDAADDGKQLLRAGSESTMRRSEMGVKPFCRGGVRGFPARNRLLPDSARSLHPRYSLSCSSQGDTNAPAMPYIPARYDDYRRAIDIRYAGCRRADCGTSFRPHGDRQALLASVKDK